MDKYYIDSILCPDGKFHKVTNEKDEVFAIDESKIIGGYGNITKPLSEIELKILAELKAKYEE